MRLSDDAEDSAIRLNDMPKCPDISPGRLTDDEFVVFECDKNESSVIFNQVS